MITEPFANAASAPSRLGRYQLRAKIADGGMATVFVGRREQPGLAPDVVAIKMIRDEFARSQEFRTMFLDEAKIVTYLRHPNIVRYDELGNEGGHLFLVMELLFGQSLWSVWEACRARKLRLRYDVIAWIGARTGDGLHYAHELTDEPAGGGGRPLDIVHRDVNATNIFITYDGQVKIIDFGLAKAANRASKTAAGIIKGKVAYMSPEQASGAPVDRRTDVFALGTTLWELSCDRRLFKHSDDVETLKRVRAADVPDPTRLVVGFPPALSGVIERALARDVDRRYATAAELARDLDAFAGPGVDGSVVASILSELFAREKVRQAAWVAEASAPGEGNGLDGPNASPRSWRDIQRAEMRAEMGVPPGPAVPPAVDRALAGFGAKAERRSRRAYTLPIAITLGVALVVGMVVLALR